MGGVPGAAAARLCPMVGFGAKKLSDALTASRVAQLRATIAAGGKAPMTYSPAPGNIGSDERYRARRSSPSTLAPRQHRLRINTEDSGAAFGASSSEATPGASVGLTPVAIIDPALRPLGGSLPDARN